MIEKLTKCNVDVWIIPLNTAFNTDLFALLSQNEKEKFAQLSQTNLQNNYLITHATTRIILSQYLNLPPCQIKIVTKTNRKPIVSDSATRARLDFNLTHSKNLCLLAISLTDIIGIDLEYKRKINNCLALAKRFFTNEEHKMLAAYDNLLRNDIFLRIWTAKEAVLKGADLGIAGNLDQFTVNFDKKNNLISINSLLEDLNKWSIYSLPLNNDFVATLAIKTNQITQINYHKFTL